MPLILLLCLLLSGCGQVGDLLGNASGGGSEEKVYSELDRLLASPDSSSTLTSKFTFVAMLLDEAEPIEFPDEGESGVYHMACISRNIEDVFYLEVGDVDGTFHSGDIVKVTGELNGFIYWTEDNSQVEILDIKASKVEAYTPEELEVDSSPTVTVDGNEIEFLGAHRASTTFNDLVVVYFNFTNNGTTDVSPDFSKFYIEYAGEQTGATIFAPSETDPQALDAGGAGGMNKTYAGKTQLYYKLCTIDTESSDDIIYFSMFDDEFRMTYDIGLTVYDSLDDLYVDDGTTSEG